MKPIHIAIASTTSKPGAVAANLRQIESLVQQAASDGADLLLTPELSASGYGPYPEVLATAEKAGAGPIYDSLAAIARATGVVICAGFVEASGDKKHLAHYVVHPDGAFIVQRKHRVTLAERPLDPGVALSGHPPDAPDPADPGQPLELRFNYFAVKGVRCAIAICADGGIVNLNETLAANRVELMLLPAGAGGQRKDRVTTLELQTEAGRARYAQWLERVFFPGASTICDCLRYRRALAAVNLCGHDGRDQYHIGHGTITNPMGEVVALIHGLPNLDRQRTMYAHAIVDVEDCLP